MSPTRRSVLQLDFDGTVTEGDPSIGLLTHFAGPQWQARIEDAGAAMLADADSPGLIEAMQEGFALLPGSAEACLVHVRAHFPPRAGMRQLIETTRRLGIDVEVVSYGFELYILDYLRSAGVDGSVAVRAGRGEPGARQRLEYTGPNGRPVMNRWKELWAQHYRDCGASVIYAGDGSSDVAAARQAAIVFARDSLLQSLPPSYEGTIRPFEDLRDVSSGLQELFSG
jgi:2-hydroxy-3-keto-5-methylthiopentenyl-1-phosphate phosphatase